MLRGKFRRKEPEQISALNLLLPVNTPPTDEERLELQASVRTLKAGFVQACGIAYAPTGHIPKVGQTFHEVIQCHLRVLSPIRHVPPEIWHEVFEQLVLSIEGRTAQHRMLGVIRLVSRGWEAAACSCPILWGNLPLIEPSTPISSPESGESAAILKRYLARSGTLPISFTYHFWRHEAIHAAERGAQHSMASAYLHALIEESHRWNVAEFRAPKATLDALLGRAQRRQLSLPLLSKFVFEMHAMEPVPANSVITVDIFDDAPRLKHVVFDVLGGWGTVNRYFVNTIVDLRVPWRQLETFEGVFERDTTYSPLLTHGVNLKALRYTSNNSDTIPLISASNLSLTKLSLFFGDVLPEDTLSTHLGGLTLPALKDLEVYWFSHPHGLTLYDTILSLVRRSGCSLERLATDHILNYNMNGQLQWFTDLLFHCSTLSHLDIAYLNPRGLSHLLLKPTNAPLPNLRVLTVRFLPRNAFRGNFPDAMALLEVIHSRRIQSRELQSRLSDVYIKSANTDWRMGVVRLGDRLQTVKELGVPFDPKLLNIVTKWKSDLLTYFPNPSRSAPSGKWDSKCHGTLAEMETFDFWGKDTRILSWLGVPAILNSIGWAKPVPGIPTYRIRQRVLNLLDKWRSQLLLDFRQSQYRWYYIDETTSRISYVGQTWDRKSQERSDWERIVGKGDIDDWAAASKGSAHLWTRPISHP